MDNVTHSIAGLVLAELAVRLRARRASAEPSPRFRAVAAISSMIAANVPDADLIYTGIGGDRLSYMLHHRGYTHTVLMALVGAALIWGGAMLVWRWRESAAPLRDDARWLAGLLLVSSLSHLVLDWTNSYGVHLFWPFDSHWSYGDSVFIIEPWFWVVSVPMLVASTTSRVARVLLSLVLLTGLALAWRVSLVSTGAATALTTGAVVSILLARRLRPGVRAAGALTAWIVVTLVLATAATRARQATVRVLHEADPGAVILDVVVTPMPANAVCMSVISVQSAGDTYRVSTARVSAAPSVTPASRCGVRGGTGSTFNGSSRRSTPSVHWDSDWTGSVVALTTLARESCPALAALRFIRVPVWRALADSSISLDDARFGTGGFSTVVVPRISTACPRAVPPWIPPRADVLGM